MPLLVRWPGKIEPGRVSDHVGAHYDALATIAGIVLLDGAALRGKEGDEPT